MCGRFSVAKSQEQLKRRFGVSRVDPIFRPSFNVSPRQKTPVILNEAPAEIRMVEWGLIPAWAQHDETYYINARAETLPERVSFKSLVGSRRCLVLADSFFEWQKQAGKKNPFRIFREDEELFAFAGVWDIWRGRMTYAIITAEPNQLVRRIHERMPVILSREEESAWLNQGRLGLLRPCPAAHMRMYEVSPLVNSPRNNSAAVFKPRAADRQTLSLFATHDGPGPDQA